MTLRKQDRSAVTWIDLNEAIRLAVRFAGDNERLVQLMSCPNWQFYDHPASLESIHGPDAVKLFPKAQEAHRAAVSFLKDALASGCIEGEGLDVRSGQRRAISEAEWATRYIDCRKNELSHPIGSTAREYPPITAVAVKSIDIENAYHCSSNPQVSEKTTMTARDETRAIQELASHFKSMQIDARKQFSKEEARRFLANRGLPFGPRPLQRIWPKAREEAGLSARAPAGAKKKSKHLIETAD